MDFVWDAAVAVASVIALTFALFSWRRSSGVGARTPYGACLPPGPRGLPLVGNVTTLLGNLTPQKAFAWSQTHGPVISFGHHEHRHLSRALRKGVQCKPRPELFRFSACFRHDAGPAGSLHSCGQFARRCAVDSSICESPPSTALGGIQEWNRSGFHGRIPKKVRRRRLRYQIAIFDFVLAGGSTVAAVLVRLLLVLATNVGTVQDRIHREIDGFIGKARQPN
ncbi:hypothetical protein MTO96_019631 [Rhipicephalus appendiculatus]